MSKWTVEKRGLLKRATRLYESQWALIEKCEPELADIATADAFRKVSVEGIEEVRGVLRIDRVPFLVLREIEVHLNTFPNSRAKVPDILTITPGDEIISEDITDTTNEDGVRLVELRSLTVRSIEDLLKEAQVNLEIWEPYDPVVKKYDQVMKIEQYEMEGNYARKETTPTIVQLWYVSVKLRMKQELLFNFAPVNLIINIPETPKTDGRGVFTSVHFGDIHFPFDDPRARSIVYEIIRKTRPGLVVDHGDTMDCHELSKYEKDPANRVDVVEEIRMAAEHFGILQSLSPHADHWWLLGNHEDRLRRQIWSLAEKRAAGAILTLPSVVEALSWENLTGVKDLGWKVVPYPKHELLFDKLILIHGSTVRPKSTESAKAEYNKYGKSGMSGHSHRRGVYEHRDYNGWHAWWEIGMLGKIREDYVDVADWQQGFVVVTWSPDKTRFAVEEIRIHDGVGFFRGEKIVGDSDPLLS